MFTLFKLVPSTVRMLMDTLKTLLNSEGTALMQDQERLKVSVSVCVRERERDGEAVLLWPLQMVHRLLICDSV